MNYGPQVLQCDMQHDVKYRGPSESFEEAMNRIAAKYAPGDRYKAYRDILLNMRFLPAGRIQSAHGTSSNCFVSGTIEDSLRVGDGSITQRLDEALGTLQQGGGIGYDFSTLRPRGALIKKLQTHSGGPLPFMSIFDSACKCISAAGHRRGAQMGMLRVDHPDIEEFIHAKQKAGVLEAFNLSIAVTDEFMEAVENDSMFWLRFDGENIREVHARTLWEMIMRSTWDWGEPGVIFIDRINAMNNLWYCETIAATNPCGEQPLPPFGACLLGSFNLPKYVFWAGDCDHDPSEGGWQFNMDALIADVPHVVRAIDQVIDHSLYPLPQQQDEARRKRRMGLGTTGVANALEALGLPYGSPEFCEKFAEIKIAIRDAAYRESIEMAKEHGPFPDFVMAHHINSRFIKTLPRDIQDGIRKHGIRNSHLLSDAPAGTISLCADNISSGVEPVFAYAVDRQIIGTDQIARTFRFDDYGLRVFGVRGKIASDVTVDEHLAVLATATKYVDSAVSKTINVDGTMAWDDFKEIYFKAWKSGCKGCTTYNADGKRGAVLVDASKEQEYGEIIKEFDLTTISACSIDPATGRSECE